MDTLSTKSAELVLDDKEAIGAWVAEQVGHGASWGISTR